MSMNIITVLPTCLLYIIDLLTNLTSVVLQIHEQMRCMRVAHEQHVSNTSTSVFHDVQCNNCAREFMTGVRYKCLFCPEYNICQDCEALTGTKTQYDPYFIHDNTHCFIKIRNSSGFEFKMAAKPQLFRDSRL